MIDKIKTFFGFGKQTISPPEQAKKKQRKNTEEKPYFEIPTPQRHEMIARMNATKDPLDRAVSRMQLQLLDRPATQPMTFTKEYWLGQCSKYLGWIRNDWELFIGDDIYLPRLKKSQQTLAEFMKNGGLVVAELGITQNEFDQLMALPETSQAEKIITLPLPEPKVSAEQENSGAKVINLVPYIEKSLRSRTQAR